MAVTGVLLAGRYAGKVKNETVANLSALPEHVIDLIDAGLKGKALVPAGEAVPGATPATARRAGCRCACLFARNRVRPCPPAGIYTDMSGGKIPRG